MDNVNYERKKVWKEQTTLFIENENLGGAAKIIVELIARYGSDAKISNYAEPYSDKEYLHVMTEEFETDAQMAKRIANEEKWAKDKEERDKAEFARLQAKFAK